MSGTGDVWAELINALQPGPLREACEARRALGIERYGQPLRRGDGRDHRRDLIEELLDAAALAQAVLGAGVSTQGVIEYYATSPTACHLLALANGFLEEEAKR